MLKVALVCHALNDPNAGVSGVTVSLCHALHNQGAQADSFHIDDLLPARWRGRASTPLYPFATTVKAALRGYDVLDVASHGLWPRGLFKRSPGDALLVNRSHGLEHLFHKELRMRAAGGELKLSWKYPLYHGGFRLWEVRRSMLAADLCLLLNATDRDYAVQTLGVESHRARIVDNGIPLSLTNLPLLLAPGHAPVRIALLGSYIPRKGIAYGIPALVEIMRRHHNVEASLLGTGVPEAKVRADFPADLQPRVQVVERFERDRLPTLLVGHSILLFPSLFEGFASAVLEAMACGLAPVVTAIPGIAERLTDGVNALIVPPRNSAALSAALEILIGSPERLSEMRRRAHALAQNFAWTRIAAQTVALYEEARGWPRPGIR